MPFLNDKLTEKQKIEELFKILERGDGSYITELNIVHAIKNYSGEGKAEFYQRFLNYKNRV